MIRGDMSVKHLKVVFLRPDLWLEAGPRHNTTNHVAGDVKAPPARGVVKVGS
jgi:hypothetical protein